VGYVEAFVVETYNQVCFFKQPSSLFQHVPTTVFPLRVELNTGLAVPLGSETNHSTGFNNLIRADVLFEPFPNPSLGWSGFNVQD
jgi:hypothetical protein